MTLHDNPAATPTMHLFGEDIGNMGLNMAVRLGLRARATARTHPSFDGDAVTFLSGTRLVHVQEEGRIAIRFERKAPDRDREGLVSLGFHPLDQVDHLRPDASSRRAAQRAARAFSLAVARQAEPRPITGRPGPRWEDFHRHAHTVAAAVSHRAAGAIWIRHATTWSPLRAVAADRPHADLLSPGEARAWAMPTCVLARFQANGGSDWEVSIDPMCHFVAEPAKLGAIETLRRVAALPDPEQVI